MSILGRIKKAAQAFNKDSNDNPLPKDTRQLTPELRKAEEVLLAKVMKEVSKEVEELWDEYEIHKYPF